MRIIGAVKNSRTTAAAAIIADAPDVGAEEAFLVVYSGSGPTSRSYVVPLPDGREVGIGRLDDNAVALDDEPVSRRHARVRRTGADLIIEDLDSRNGTRVNGVTIAGPTRIKTGDEITIGSTSILVGVTSRGVRETARVGLSDDLHERLAAELDRAARYHRRLGLFMIRIDGERRATERVLGAIKQTLRRMDFIAEYGPAEYAIMLPEADRAVSEETAARLIDAARGASAEPSVHIGVATCPEDGTSAGQLLSRARSALRVARKSGPASHVSSPPVEAAQPDSDIIVVDPMMKRVYSMARKVANTPITVLVLGETGAGKELVANAIHRESKRASRPFQALNCSALTQTLLESELFGHERGAFTGADRRKSGYFEAAQGGTIFLDEIGEMPLEVQAKLLRVLELRTITRVGGTENVKIDVRVVCATNRDLEVEVKAGRFREDLYFRISAFSILVPSLRDRRAEIMPLATHFARQYALELGQPPPTFTSAASELLKRYDWPGNVRELRNAIERAVVLMPDGTIDADHLPDRMVARAGAQTTFDSGYRPQPGASPSEMGIRDRVTVVEREAVLEALAACDGNQTRAAKRMGISRYALIRLIKKYGFTRSHSKA